MQRDKRLCQACKRAGLIRVATDVDHIVPRSDGGVDGLSNLEALCRDCHKAKTARESKRARFRLK